MSANKIISQWTHPYAFQQNGVAERKKSASSRCCLNLTFRILVTFTFCVKAFSIVIRIINRIPSPKLQHQKPYCCLFAKHPRYDYLHTFGCICFVHLPCLEGNKLSTQFIKCCFLGCGPHWKGFLCYNSEVQCFHLSRIFHFFFFLNVNIFVY